MVISLMAMLLINATDNTGEDLSIRTGIGLTVVSIGWAISRVVIHLASR